MCASSTARVRADASSGLSWYRFTRPGRIALAASSCFGREAMSAALIPASSACQRAIELSTEILMRKTRS